MATARNDRKPNVTIRSFLLTWVAPSAYLLCTACGSAEDAPVRVSVVGEPKQISAPLTHISSDAGQVSLAGTARGLVAYDASGDVIPALAQRWIVVDDGRSYIFRLRRAHWANGDRVDAGEVRLLLRDRVRAARKIDPYGSLASVTDILAMTGDVLEIRLSTPRTNFLPALAQPVMAIARNTGGTGPYRKEQRPNGGHELLLTPVESIGGSDQPRAERDLRLLRAERAAMAVSRFNADAADLVLGGTLADLPYVTLAEVEEGSVRFDPVQGLFGLALTSRNPMFDDPQVRDALSMAIEREAIIAYFGISRWKIADRILPQQMNLPHAPTAPVWSIMTMDARRDRALGTIARWRAQHGDKPVRLSVALPEGPGMDLLFVALSTQYRKIGVELERVERKADLTLIDEVAPYDSVSWYLGQVSCARGVHCDEKAEELLKASVSTGTMQDRLNLLGEAEPLIQAHGGFISLATPVRWSLVARRLNAFAPTPRAHHNLRWLIKE